MIDYLEGLFAPEREPETEERTAPSRPNTPDLPRVEGVFPTMGELSLPEGVRPAPGELELPRQPVFRGREPEAVEEGTGRWLELGRPAGAGAEEELRRRLRRESRRYDGGFYWY